MNTDKRLQTDVMNELNWEPSVEAAHVGVSAQDGSITLTGHVPNFAAKMRAVKAAERVYAVRAVADELEVRLPSSHTHDDSTIAEAIAHNLRWNVAVPHEIDVKVAKGWVTLSGKVDSHFQSEAARHAVEFHAGVCGVVNLIEVNKRVKSSDVQKLTSDVQKLIGSAFQRNANLDARQIQITSDNGTIHLRGNVHSVNESRAARHAAYAAPGVTNVDNQLVVTP